MLANLGYGATFITFLVSIYAVAAALYGLYQKKPNWVDSSRNAMLLTFPLLTLSSAILLYFLGTHHYEVEYVAHVTSRTMPLYLRLTAWWGGQAGSLLFWSWLMSAFASAVTLRKWDRDREFLPWVVVISSVTLAFFLALNIFVENPFARLWQFGTTEVVKAMFPPPGGFLYFPADGQGLNPLLRHPGMVIHPPLLYLGFVSFVIPYAFALSALITGRTDDRWIRITRRWTLWAWLFLSLGLVLGGRWAYDVLGWGGYWGWDPVEIAAFMPWLTGTAFLHSVMIQEKRGLLKQWNMVLIILTYDLVIFGTFLTRSGVLSSVHAFAQSAIGPLFFAFIGITLTVSLALVMHRWRDLKAEVQMTSLLSREALFLLNNLLLMGILIVCFWGVIFPLISELVTGQKVTVGPPFYERATGPLFAGLLLLMGIAPLSAWRYSTLKTLGRSAWKPALVSIFVPVILVIQGMRNFGAIFGFWLIAFVTFVTVYDFWRSVRARSRARGDHMLASFWHLLTTRRRRYGGYIIHLGVICMSLGIIGIEIFQTETQGTLALNEQISLGRYSMSYDQLDIYDVEDGRNVARAVVGVYKDGQRIDELYPRRDFFYDSQQPMTIPGVRSTIEDDFYILLVDWEEISTQRATFKVYHNPLVKWMWIGSWVFLVGTLVAAWPDKDPAYNTSSKRRKVRAAVKV
ncbi:MAG: heme lyase CcmF/NrfE family subunit [Chloroflexota bacterium]